MQHFCEPLPCQIRSSHTSYHRCPLLWLSGWLCLRRAMILVPALSQRTSQHFHIGALVAISAFSHRCLVASCPQSGIYWSKANQCGTQGHMDFRVCPASAFDSVSTIYLSYESSQCRYSSCRRPYLFAVYLYGLLLRCQAANIWISKLQWFIKSQGDTSVFDTR